MKSRYKVFIFEGIILLVAIISILSIIAATPPKERKIKIGTAYVKNLAQTVSAEGIVEPNRKQVINLDPAQKVVEVFVSEDQEVKKGDLIVALDSSDNQHKLKVEEINLGLARNELKKVQNNEEIEKKDIEYSLTTAQNALENARVTLNKAKLKFEGDKLLFEKGAISKAEYEGSLESIKEYENSLLMKEMEWERAKHTFDNYSLSKEEKLYELNSNLSLIEENINNLKNKVDADTRANIDGRVVKLEVEKDQYPSEEASEILIYDMSKYIIDVQVRQKDVLYIKEGMKAKIKIKGLDAKEYEGTITDVDDIALSSVENGKEAKVNVKIEFDNPDEMLKIGYEAEVKVDLKIKPQAVVVDFESIVQDNDGKKYIYYVKDNQATKVPVRTGIETSFEVEILEGLIRGDKYIMNPSEDIQEKNSLRIWGWRYEAR